MCLRKSPFVWLLEKEWRELLSSRAWWVMLILIGPLVGVSFISAVRTYAELSGYGGTAEGVGAQFAYYPVATAHRRIPISSRRTILSCIRRSADASACGRRQTARAISRVTWWIRNDW
ncbi:MAG TPA: hypothetical protein VEL51_17925 [Vicinamibacterales bacterium]|nr:hypothetical protein [Vicinamibacterales bacterium]